MAKQFPNVGGQYGAPMGRSEFGNVRDCARRSIRIFRVLLDSGGYDDGGAYWGVGDPLFCAEDGADYRQFGRDFWLSRCGHAAAYGTNAAISRFAYASLTAANGWLEFDGRPPC